MHFFDILLLRCYCYAFYIMPMLFFSLILMQSFVNSFYALWIFGKFFSNLDNNAFFIDRIRYFTIRHLAIQHFCYGVSQASPCFPVLVTTLTISHSPIISLMLFMPLTALTKISNLGWGMLTVLSTQSTRWQMVCLGWENCCTPPFGRLLPSQ